MPAGKDNGTCFFFVLRVHIVPLSKFLRRPVVHPVSAIPTSWPPIHMHPPAPTRVPPPRYCTSPTRLVKATEVQPACSVTPSVPAALGEMFVVSGRHARGWLSDRVVDVVDGISPFFFVQLLIRTCSRLPSFYNRVPPATTPCTSTSAVTGITPLVLLPAYFPQPIYRSSNPQRCV
ncbi:hypothetical protein EXIGLDRAFT_726376 [Exidia glandulosa HHB12029]|uniref:Uncharacterized protein n=1 Tax=Exidia glandulosa HHB12029 TaxID=1314781 RepID=A0A165DQR9_EXIGL|nr:hypothetical protein EXIGLDRAFT_726376 [Exidia glandulosa HHB12029]